MTLTEFLTNVSASGCHEINVEHHQVMLGNPDGSGNYRLIILTYNGNTLRFKETDNGWILT